jgi:hypothetical protein
MLNDTNKPQPLSNHVIYAGADYTVVVADCPTTEDHITTADRVHVSNTVQVNGALPNEIDENRRVNSEPGYSIKCVSQLHGR